MSKILSIVIPSYNMEKYLNRCVDSMLVQDALNALEIIIVNDGSKDKTIDIANAYKMQYPDTVVVIDKPNGHYGSCINAALKIATGKYFRIVDADDWVDSDALKKFVEKLNELDVDAVYTPFATHKEETNETIPSKSPVDLKWDTVRLLKDVVLDIGYLRMHSLTYNLRLLKSINYTQTEGVCYTDNEYVYMPLTHAQTIYCINLSLYQYYFGRNDQSMSIINLSRNFNHFLTVLKSIVSYPKPTLIDANFKYLRASRILILLNDMMTSEMLTGFKNKKNELILRETITNLVESGEDLSLFWDYTLRDRFHLNRWWYKDDFVSKIKLTLFMSARKIKNLI